MNMTHAKAETFLTAYCGGKQPTLEQITYCAAGISALEGDITPEAQQAAYVLLDSYAEDVGHVGEGLVPYDTSKGPICKVNIPQEDPKGRRTMRVTAGGRGDGSR